LTIKKRIKTAFVTLVGLIILLSGTLVVSLSIQQKYFSKYVEIKNLTLLTNEIMQYLVRKRQYMDYYMVLHYAGEKDNFNSVTPQTIQLIKEYESKIKTDILSLKFERFIKSAQKIFNETNYNRKLHIIDVEFFPLYLEMYNFVDKNNQQYLKQITEIENLIIRISMISVFVTIVVIALSLFIVIFFGIKISNSLINPLKTLSEATKVLSKGEYKEVHYNQKDEFLEVVHAFNNMVKNLKSLQSQVIQMDRLSNIGQLAGGIAHELNNPLVGVLGQAQILAEKIPPELKEHVEKIEHAAKRCKESVSRLLQFSRQKLYEYTFENINDVIDNTLFIADSEIKAYNIEIIKNYTQNLPKVKISLPHIQQAFLNIINNAIHAISLNKTEKNFLQISTKLAKVNTELGIKDFVSIEFHDTGCGIEPSYLNTIFEPFFTTKDRNKNAGVGLAITKDIITHHKGKISAYSEGKNKGAKFTIYLPI
ncbi:MAG: HAMP domain-containing sensor histidine kinase, partial [Endomicrobiia bacterium]